ncbi:peroxiredoxin [Alcanivorax sp. DP30]|uniref:peroxiredoxin family protein n=1 Tax=Alcanivorax sp. DP30 TaxID=2606217 RepID=UPI00136E6DE8|nr:redoxin domain-containing protein [Alcanivorax sp. DP30]MZR62013.1 redoxin domain-containing protein [Alcanivorax sp. DP30]
MKSLKSLFISGQITLAVGSVIVAVWLTAGGNLWAPALLLPALPLLVFLGWLFLRQPARTSANLPWVFWPSLAGTLLVLVLFALGHACWLMTTLAVLNLIGVHLYIRWYSRYEQRGPVVQLGEPLPPVSFTNLEGKVITPQSFAGQPLVLLFFRGNWCPLCMAQIREVAAEYQSLQEKGIRVALVSPQSHKQSAQLAKQFSVQFEYLRDDDNQAANVLGIIDAGGTPAGLEALGYDSDTVMPTVLILDGEGRLIYQHLTDNYRVRPEPSLFIRVLMDRELI